jgi:hypothetical protein
MSTASIIYSLNRLIWERESLKRIVSGIVSTMLLVSMLALTFYTQPVKAATSSLYMINPGPGSYPAKWSASNPDTGCIGTSYFNFTGDQYGKTFFVNVTISNVSCMRAWGIGVIYDNTTLDSVIHWRPSDHVFRPVEDMGWSLVLPADITDDVDATHRRIDLWCFYEMGSPSWCFNGTGQLCQIEFRIIKHVNGSDTLAEAAFSLDPSWTQVGLYPTGAETPNLNPAYLSVVFALIGDVDGDGKVDMGDIVALCDAFGSTPEKPNWNPNCDLDHDGSITMGDIVIGLDHFGQHYP